MNTTVLVLARAGSKGIRRKNVRDLCGRPLISWVLKEALEADVGRVIVSTDDYEIKEVAEACGAEVPFIRPASLASDTAKAYDAVLHALEKLRLEGQVAVMQPTSPLVLSSDVLEALELKSKKEARSVVSVTESPLDIELMCRVDGTGLLKQVFPTSADLNRQDFEPTFLLNGALYINDVAWLRAGKSLVSSSTFAYVMPPERSVDIDNEDDWQLAVDLMSERLGF